MAQNKIELKSVAEIEDMEFHIPSYQRGYRWTEQQVKDLLNDINEHNPAESDFYCLQPLVIKERDGDIFTDIKNNAKDLEDVKRMLRGRWEVIDGQQRLTTLFITLTCLTKKAPWKLEYETRKGSKEFLQNLGDKGKLAQLYRRNMDYYHIGQAYKTITDWIDEQGEKLNITEFTEKIRTRIKFIWYESVDEDPIKVFTRLNIGKISLTNSELIKALLLNSSNYKKTDVILHQEQKAVQWDEIEYTLQNDDFWLFLNNIGYDKPTRIDLIFEIIKEKDLLKINYKNDEALQKRIGTDGYATFRYFYEYFHTTDTGLTLADKLENCWGKVKQIFNIFYEWFNDIQLYHYIGYLVANNVQISTLLDYWFNTEDGKTSKDKNMFIKELIKLIKDKIRNCNDLNKQYELNSSAKKTVCRPLLLLHNVQTVINQSQNAQKVYGEHIFVKFPFHLYKKEKWDVEHIDSNTENSLESSKHRNEWLLYSTLDSEVKSNPELYNRILAYLNKDMDNDQEFKELYDEILKISTNTKVSGDEKKLTDEEKNKIGNFVLLDAGTNRGYGNAIFPVKRRIIIGKDQGIKFTVSLDKKGAIDTNEETEKVNNDICIKEEIAKSAFIPPCTKYAFMKYYNVNSGSIKYWDKDDANCYRTNIYNTLHDLFGVIDSSIITG